MANSAVFGCEYCGRNNFRSEWALRQHQERGNCALARNQDASRASMSISSASRGQLEQDDDDAQYFTPSPPRRPQGNAMVIHGIPEVEIDEVRLNINALWDEVSLQEDDSTVQSEGIDEVAQELDALANLFNNINEIMERSGILSAFPIKCANTSNRNSGSWRDGRPMIVQSCQKVIDESKLPRW